MSKPYLFLHWLIATAVCTMLAPVVTMAQPPAVWTLESSVRRAIEVAPETQAARAAVQAREGALRQAGAWPNPEIELRADNKIGKEDGRGGTDLTQLTLSQPLPLSGRLGHQQAVAGAELDAARTDRSYQQMRLETQVAQRFHSLQLATDRLRLAEQRLRLADELQNAGQRRERAGELSTLERLRLDLIREAAQQVVDKSEGEYSEAVSQFRAYLGLSAQSPPQLEPLQPFGALPALSTLQTSLRQHPALLAAQQRVAAAQAGVDLARAERLPDPSLRLFHDRDFLDGRRQNITGIGVGLTLPLWDRNGGGIDAARAQVIRAQSERQVLERDLSSRLQQSYLHLNHLVQQGEHYRSRVFQPARQVFDMTRKAYHSGELEILALIDAINTYFDAHERYLELLQAAWLESAELRLAAGRPLVPATQDTPHE